MHLLNIVTYISLNKKTDIFFKFIYAFQITLQVTDFRPSDSKITNASSEFYIPTQCSVKYRLCASNVLKPSSYSKTFGFSKSMNALVNNYELLKYHTKRVCSINLYLSKFIHQMYHSYLFRYFVGFHVYPSYLRPL